MTNSLPFYPLILYPWLLIMMPDCIKITHQPKTMATPTIRVALTSDDICPGPLSEDDLRRGWNQQADEHNQWESLDSAEQLAWAQALAIKADRHAAALKAEPRRQGPTDEDLYDLAAEFNGDPVPAMRRALELWGNPLQGAPAPGENLATPSAPGDVTELGDQQREAVYQAVAEALGSGAYDCLRVWSAWSYGTMGPDDFAPVAEDSDRVAEIADAAIEVIRAIPALAPEPKRLFRIADELDP